MTVRVSAIRPQSQSQFLTRNSIQMASAPLFENPSFALYRQHLIT